MNDYCSRCRTARDLDSTVFVPEDEKRLPVESFHCGTCGCFICSREIKEKSQDD